MYIHITRMVDQRETSRKDDHSGDQFLFWEPPPLFFEAPPPKPPPPPAKALAGILPRPRPSRRVEVRHLGPATVQVPAQGIGKGCLQPLEWEQQTGVFLQPPAKNEQNPNKPTKENKSLAKNSEAKASGGGCASGESSKLTPDASIGIFRLPILKGSNAKGLLRMDKIYGAPL